RRNQFSTLPVQLCYSRKILACQLHSQLGLLALAAYRAKRVPHHLEPLGRTAAFWALKNSVHCTKSLFSPPSAASLFSQHLAKPVAFAHKSCARIAHLIVRQAHKPCYPNAQVQGC